jgi:hypothetical protein
MRKKCQFISRKEVANFCRENLKPKLIWISKIWKRQIVCKLMLSVHSPKNSESTESLGWAQKLSRSSANQKFCIGEVTVYFKGSKKLKLALRHQIPFSGFEGLFLLIWASKVYFCLFHIKFPIDGYITRPNWFWRPNSVFGLWGLIFAFLTP